MLLLLGSTHQHNLCAPGRAAEQVLALEEHAVGLFLAVITQADAGVAEADVITSHAFLALVFNVVAGE